MARFASPAGIYAAPVGFNNDGTIYPIDGSIVNSSTCTTTRDTVIRRGTSPASQKHDAGVTNGVTQVTWSMGAQGNIGWYVRRYFYFTTLPGAIGGGTAQIMVLSDNPGNLVVATITAAGKLRLSTITSASVTTQQGSDSNMVVQTGRWYRVELYGNYPAGAGACECAARIAPESTEIEETIGPFTGITLSTSMITTYYWGFYNIQDAGTIMNSCDGAINSDQGTTQNSWPGKCANVFYSLPISDNARGADWKDGAGGTTNLWDAVNNTPPVGVADASSTATSQIKNANTTDTTENYDANMQNYAATGLKPGTYIKVIQSVLGVASSGVTNVTFGQTLVSNPATAEDQFSTGRSEACGAWGAAGWRATWGTPVYYSLTDTQPNPGSSPVLRVGRRAASIETMEVAFMGIAFESDVIPAPNAYLKPIGGRGATWMRRMLDAPWRRKRSGLLVPGADTVTA